MVRRNGALRQFSHDTSRSFSGRLGCQSTSHWTSMSGRKPGRGPGPEKRCQVCIGVSALRASLRISHQFRWVDEPEALSGFRRSYACFERAIFFRIKIPTRPVPVNTSDTGSGAAAEAVPVKLLDTPTTLATDPPIGCMVNCPVAVPAI